MFGLEQRAQMMWGASNLVETGTVASGADAAGSVVGIEVGTGPEVTLDMTGRGESSLGDGRAGESV